MTVQTPHPVVALFRSSPQSIHADYQCLFTHLELAKQIDPDRPVVLVARVWRTFQLAATWTPPWLLEAAAAAIRALGVRELRLMLPGASVAARRHDAGRYLPICQAYTIHPVMPGPGTLVGTQVILLSTLICHVAHGLAGASLLAAETISSAGATTVTEATAELAQARSLAHSWLAVLDATTVGDGPGPYLIYPQIRSMLLGSHDPLAVDTIAAQIAGVDLPLRRAMSAPDPSAIRLLGEPALAAERWQLTAQNVAIAAPYRLVDQLPTPVRQIASELTASYRWMTLERHTFANWLHTTDWGQLMQSYLVRK